MPCRKQVSLRSIAGTAKNNVEKPLRNFLKNKGVNIITKPISNYNPQKRSHRQNNKKRSTKMPWNLFILPLVGGYYMLTQCYGFKFHPQRLDRQGVIFETVLIGRALIAVTYSIRIVLDSTSSIVLHQIHRFSPFTKPYGLMSLASLDFTELSTELFNEIPNDVNGIKKSIEEIGKELENILKYSFELESLLLITLYKDKAYMAWVKELPFPSQSPYFRILPAVSRFRT